MAIRQVAGGIPVYSIEVDVPKPTDSRGKGYGSLVSDLRWKLWEEVQASQLRQMEFEKMNQQAQLDVLEQKQRDISRAIRDAKELQTKIVADTSSKDEAMKQYISAQKARSGGGGGAGSYTETYTQAVGKYTGKPLFDKEGKPVMIKSESTRTPLGGKGAYIAPDIMKELEKRALGGDKTAQKQIEDAALADAAARRKDLEDYINQLEAEQTQVGQQFQEFVAQGPGQDILSRTRDAFQTQIGEGGFGISKRPLRQVSRFDELQAIGLLDDTIKREEENLMSEAQKMATAPITLQQEQQIRQLARDRVKQQMDVAGATPTSSRGFLMKEMPQIPTYVPSSPERPPTPRGVLPVESTPISRANEIKSELDFLPGGLSNPQAEGLLNELEDIKMKQRATSQKTTSPLSAAIQREVELEALGATPEEIANAKKTTAGIQKVMEEERLATGAMPANRGFTSPVENFGPVTTTTGGVPGGLMDRLALRRLQRQSEATPVSSPIVTTSTPQSVSGVNPDDIIIGRKNAGEEIPRAIPDQPVVPSEMPVKQKNKLMKERPALPPVIYDELPEGADTAKATTQARKDLYAMRVAKKGIELAEKPKQFARIAKTENPSNAPEYIKVVNGVYDVNKTRPDKFKLTYDEVARVYKNDPSTRQKAHEYLIAKDAIESNITQPLA